MHVIRLCRQHVKVNEIVHNIILIKQRQNQRALPIVALYLPSRMPDKVVLDNKHCAGELSRALLSDVYGPDYRANALHVTYLRVTTGYCSESYFVMTRVCSFALLCMHVAVI